MRGARLAEAASLTSALPSIAVGMGLDGLQQVAGATVMQEKQPLAYAPQWRGAELVGSRRSLRDAIRQPRSHVVEGKVRVGMVGDVAHAGEARTTGGEVW